MEILRVENLSKVYGKGENKVVALDNVSFSVEKGEFVAIVGASGSGKSTLLHLVGGVDRPTKEKFIQNIKREITNISSLVGEILKLSKFDASVIKFEEQQVFIDDIVKNAISNVEMMAELKNINIEVNNRDNIKLVCDAKWQIEAITNILKNCIEHSKDDSTITIDIDSNKIYKQITIKDNGEGIDEKDLPHIFERFYKGKNSSKDSVGIGLALAKTIIEKDNGSINVDSKKGRQTTFVIKYY